MISPNPNPLPSGQNLPKNAEERLLHLLESITDAFFGLNKEWHFTYLNRQAEVLLQRSREELLGKCIWEEFAQAVGSKFYTEYHRAVTDQVTATFEEFYPPLDTWFAVHAYPSEEGLSVFFEDIGARKQEEERQRRRQQRAAFGADVGEALNKNETLQTSLQACAQAMVAHLDAAFARVWTLGVGEDVLELQASAGLYTHLDGPHSRVPVGQFKIGLIAQEREPHLTNAVIGDVRVGDQEWAQREGMVAFAGYPLIADDQVVGVMAMFARQPILENTLNALALVADTLAQTIQRKRAEESLHKSEELLRTTLRSIGDAVIATDAQGRIRFMNTVAERLTGWTQAEATDCPSAEVFRIVNETTRQEVESPLVRAIEQGVVVGLANHTVLISRDGTEWPVEDSGAPILADNGDIVGAVLVFRDVSARRETQARIEAMNAKLQRAMTETHHRVKNNLQIISAMIDMQKGTGRKTVPMSELERLGQNVSALGIIHDILTKEAKTSDGDGQIERISIKEVLENLLSTMQQAVGGRRLRYQIADVRLSGKQATSLTLITNELVSNALKHSAADIAVHFTVQAEAARMEVQDEGPGFPSDFDPVKAANTGLDLIENIARWDLRGQTRFENRAGGGACVSVTFPM